MNFNIYRKGVLIGYLPLPVITYIHDGNITSINFVGKYVEVA